MPLARLYSKQSSNFEAETEGDPSFTSSKNFSSLISPSFAYLNPRPQQTIASLSSFSSLRCVHFCCSPDSIAESLNLLKNAPHRPVIVYEPIPFSCKPSRFPEIVSILPLIDVFSPNHKELSLLFDNFHATVEALTEKLASLGGRTVVIRAGSRGCYIANENPALGHCQKQWMPAYWTAEEVDQVRGTTGAGNSFLGGLCAGILLESPLDIFRAAMYGSVSASFVVQQTGLPVLGMDGKWNGEEPGDRLTRYMTALPVTIINDSAIK